MKNKKQLYLAPEIVVLDVEVEKGFAASVGIGGLQDGGNLDFSPAVSNFNQDNFQ